jgi:hypothetical protein
MHLRTISSRKFTALAALLLLLAALGVSACGSSSSSKATNAAATTSTQPGSTGSSGGANGATGGGSGSGSPAPGGAGGSGATGSPAPGSGPAGRGGQRFAKVRECLQKQGITLPKVRPGGGPYGGPRGLLRPGTGGPQLPKGMTRAQFEAAVKKCGGGSFGRARFFGGAARLNNPAYRQALSRFAACLRRNGVNVPPPNTSGNGPIFNTKGINTASAQFRTARMKCAGELRGALRPGSSTSRPPAG